MAQSCHHFVKQKQPGAGGECLGELQASRIGHRQLPRQPVSETGHSDLFEHLIGGLATCFLGGFLVLWVSRWKVAKGFRGVMPVAVIPLVSTLLTAGIFITVLGRPIKGLSDGLTSALNGMNGSSAIVLGVVLGAMMGFDFGGPVNKRLTPSPLPAVLLRAPRPTPHS